MVWSSSRRRYKLRLSTVRCCQAFGLFSRVQSLCREGLQGCLVCLFLLPSSSRYRISLFDCSPSHDSRLSVSLIARLKQKLRRVNDDEDCHHVPRGSHDSNGAIHEARHVGTRFEWRSEQQESNKGWYAALPQGESHQSSGLERL